MLKSLRFDQMLDQLAPAERAPIVFLGHGNPLYAITDNAFAKSWQQLGEKLARPQAILCISAHWETRNSTLVHVGAMPKTIHDFYGFPQELFDVQYPAAGAPELAQEVALMLKNHAAIPTEEWGLDHGAWAVLRHLYPDADIPVFQISINRDLGFADQVALGRDLKALRDRGVLILGSGNLVHNLRAISRDVEAFDWAQEFDQKVADYLTDRNFADMANPDQYGTLLPQAHPSVEHFAPAFYCAGLVDQKDQLAFFNDQFDMGSLSMRSFIYY
ncbi:4,5-DOPA dioxygenase extradiol [Maritalea mobilis]|uniref:4,5-DOPA dioxygenase extradiol n=1 Tax=Maritalea mobilis TaxID=483324 RepID=A0A4R6VWX3_9HYPH|nr:4,5-DOPA dioxygenase extradiol [Maritalea mobilis]TDQ67347.1 4,5-DOPA dioxygenase extradiol [Maritalea mobilis]